jgi:transcription elongation factor GreA
VADEIHRITQETLEKLKAEYTELTTVGRTEIARVIEAARLLGDLSENGDYHAAKDAQGKMESRIRQIDQVIRNHEIVKRDESAGTVQYASIVKADGVLVASPTSPLGEALLGKSVGDTVEYEAPSGVLKVKIVGLH